MALTRMPSVAKSSAIVRVRLTIAPLAAKSASLTSPTCTEPSLLAARRAAMVSCRPPASRSTSATHAPWAANKRALARPMPEPAPVMIAVRCFHHMSSHFPVLRPPRAQIGGGGGTAEPRAPPELFLQPRYRKRRTIGRAMQVDRGRLAGLGQPADEARMQGCEILSPLQRRPF